MQSIYSFKNSFQFIQRRNRHPSMCFAKVKIGPMKKEKKLKKAKKGKPAPISGWSVLFLDISICKSMLGFVPYMGK